MTAASVTQVGIDLLGFAEQIGNVLFRRFDQPRKLPKLFGKLGRKLSLLLVTPGLLQLVHLGPKPHRSFFEIFDETVEMACELTQLFGVDDGLIHEQVPEETLGIGK